MGYISEPKFEFSPKELDDIINSPYLKRRERLVVNLFYREGLKYEEIALELNPQVNRKTVYNILRDARRKIAMYHIS